MPSDSAEHSQQLSPIVQHFLSQLVKGHVIAVSNCSLIQRSAKGLQKCIVQVIMPVFKKKKRFQLSKCSKENSESNYKS